MMRRFLLVLVLLGVAGCADSVRDVGAICPLIRLAEIPLETHGDMLFVRAAILGSPVMLLVDTGAERTLLTEAAVDRLHLPRDYQHATRTYGIGSPTATWDARLPDGLTLGGTHFPADSITVGRFSIMHVAGEAADGLLGADILLASDIDLDVANRRLTLYRTRPACPDAGPPWNEPYITLDGIVTRHDRLLVPFELDGVAGYGRARHRRTTELDQRAHGAAARSGGRGAGGGPDSDGARCRTGSGRSPDPSLPRAAHRAFGDALANAAGGADVGWHGRCAVGDRLPARTACLGVVCHEPGVRHAD